MPMSLKFEHYEMMNDERSDQLLIADIAIANGEECEQYRYAINL